MKIQIHSIIDKGKLQSERVALRVQEDCNLMFYCLHLTYELPEGGFYNRSKQVYWFPPQQVRTGDWIVISTKTGSSSSRINQDESTSYFHYLGLDQTIFNNPNDAIVLAEINTWQMKNNK